MLKFNLKKLNDCATRIEIWAWKDGLEAELRERLEELKNVKGRRSAICKAHEAGEIETIRDILGE